jgi:2'-5' RNA ligase
MTVKTTHEDPLPHCTLARIKHGAQTEKLVLHADVPGKELNVDAAELWKTVQTKDGVVYERLEKWQF